MNVKMGGKLNIMIIMVWFNYDNDSAARQFNKQTYGNRCTEQKTFWPLRPSNP